MDTGSEACGREKRGSGSFRQDALGIATVFFICVAKASALDEALSNKPPTKVLMLFFQGAL